MTLALAPQSNLLAQALDENNDKVDDSLELMIIDKLFPTYKGSDLIDVVIQYKKLATGEDINALYKFGGRIDIIRNDKKAIRAGLPIDTVRLYTLRENVAVIAPYYKMKEFFEGK